MRRDNNHRISLLEVILTSGDDDFSFSADARHQNVFPGLHILQLDFLQRTVLMYNKLQRLYPVVHQLVQRFHIASDGVFHRAHILKNILCGNTRSSVSLSTSSTMMMIERDTLDRVISTNQASLKCIPIISSNYISNVV